MNIRPMSLTVAKQSDEVMSHLHRLRHEHGWFNSLLTRRSLNTNEVLILLASMGGLPVGALYAHGLRVGIFVDPPSRRRGVGTMLMNEAYLRLGEGISCVPDDDASLRFFASLRKDMRLCLLPNMDTDWAPAEFLI